MKIGKTSFDFDLTKLVQATLAITEGLGDLDCIISLFFPDRRSTRDATLRAYNELNDQIFSLPSYKKTIIQAGAALVAPCTPGALQLLRLADDWLNRIDRFSAGVNAGVYDLKFLRRIAGKSLAENFERWKPFIVTKRNLENQPTQYAEFQRLYNKLSKP